ncbi:unnamed protein product [Paramecium sonneborni]|uniref:Uncharacterized protein n=1 Tax=Paramecium sonneborni TaxID=65129 RepID=A0A8S1KFL1_9CILI|nr:unnamed protein product [Paramecium sonneborni]
MSLNRIQEKAQQFTFGSEQFTISNIPNFLMIPNYHLLIKFRGLIYNYLFNIKMIYEYVRKENYLQN